jgi:hypothetical protein
VSKIVWKPFFAKTFFGKFYKTNSMWRNYLWILALWFISESTVSSYTAKTKYQNFETNIPRKGITGSQSQFPHSCVCERFIYSHDRSPYSAGGNKYVDRSWDYINRSETHECWNWCWGRAIPRKGIHNGDFRCSVIVTYGHFVILFDPAQNRMCE